MSEIRQGSTPPGADGTVRAIPSYASRLRARVDRELHGRSPGAAARDLLRLARYEGWRGVTSRMGITIARHPRPSGKREPEPEPSPVEEALHDRVFTYPWSLAFDSYFDLTPAELAANAAVLARFDDRPADIESATWFLPRFDHALFGGVYTILRVMAWMAENHEVEHRLVIYDGQFATDGSIRGLVTAAFPVLGGIDIVLPPTDARLPVDELPPTDIAVCSLWSSAYALARFNATKAKFYFVQDFEPSFYPAGTSFALAEATYRLGFGGLVNTPGLAEIYAGYGNPAVGFLPAVDVAAPDVPKPSAQGGQPVQIVLYGRPSIDRNGFELIAAAAVQLKERFGERVRIISAGEAFEPRSLRLDGIVENAGLLGDLGAVRDLYMKSDIGVCFMFSKHPSYQPFEYLAARMAPVCNVNAATSWMLRDGENCILTEPYPSSIAAGIGRLVEDPELRNKIAASGHEQVVAVDWESELERIWGFLTNRASAE